MRCVPVQHALLSCIEQGLVDDSWRLRAARAVHDAPSRLWYYAAQVRTPEGECLGTALWAGDTAPDVRGVVDVGQIFAASPLALRLSIWADGGVRGASVECPAAAAAIRCAAVPAERSSSTA